MLLVIIGVATCFLVLVSSSQAPRYSKVRGAGGGPRGLGAPWGPMDNSHNESNGVHGQRAIYPRVDLLPGRLLLRGRQAELGPRGRPSAGKRARGRRAELLRLGASRVVNPIVLLA